MTPPSDPPAGAPRPGATLQAWIDGGARGNPGPAGYGAHVVDEAGEPVEEIWGFLDTRTNNVAEYAGLIAALEYAVRTGAAALHIRSDSELLVRQIRGQYKVKNAALKVLHGRARQRIARLPAFRIEHVRREANREADGLANRAMDDRQGSGHFTIEEILG